MLKDLRILGKEAAVYGLSTVVARLLNFLLLPFYTHFLSPGEYGAVTTAYSYIAFLNIVFLLGFDQAYLRFAAGSEDARAESTFSTAFWVLAAWGAAAAGLVALMSGPLAAAGGITVDGPAVTRCAAAIILLDTLAAPAFAELRLRHRAWAFAGIKSFNIVVSVVLNVAFVGALHLGVRGVFLAGVASSAATLALLAPVVASRLRPRFDRVLARAMLRFGLPLIPAGLGAMVVQVADRPILLKMTDSATVGIYQANYRLGIFMMLFVTTFDQAFRPFYFERAEAPGTPALLARVFTLFLAAASWLALALSLFLPDLARLELAGRPVIHSAYWEGLGVVPVVLFAYVLHGAYVNFLAPVTIAKQTESVAAVTALGALVNVMANLVLIPRMGMMGAAWATLAAYAAMAAQMRWFGRRAMAVPYEWDRVARALAPVGAAGLAAWLLRPALPPSAWTGARVLLLLAVPAAWLPLGVLTGARTLPSST
ncbi:MAG: oligosaccharide flippase family protein [Elusimicrobia bacterium]|nr:oligosaccharide flippase family protein [Elusimicrobiota bacterium]